MIQPNPKQPKALTNLKKACYLWWDRDERLGGSSSLRAWIKREKEVKFRHAFEIKTRLWLKRDKFQYLWFFIWSLVTRLWKGRKKIVHSQFLLREGISLGQYSRDKDRFTLLFLLWFLRFYRLGFLLDLVLKEREQEIVCICFSWYVCVRVLRHGKR